MTRTEIIRAIFSQKDRAIGLGFDWPSNDDVTEVQTRFLYSFLLELEQFFEEN